MPRRANQSYPRINCCVPGCKRGTTTFKPGTRMICGKCWRKAPKEMRQEYSYWRRRGTALDKRGDPRADICHRKCNRAWNAILLVLTGIEHQGDDLPPLVAEELRKAGLL